MLLDLLVLVVLLWCNLFVLADLLDLLVGLDLALARLAGLAFAALEEVPLLTVRAARVGSGAAALSRFSTTDEDVSSSPATRARAAPSDRAGAATREDGNTAPAASILAFVFMATNVWGCGSALTPARAATQIST